MMKLHKTIHRLLAIVLALNLSLGLVNVTALADEFEQPDSAERILACDKEEHTHTDECYGEPVPVCGLEAGEGHTHTEACYGEVETLICEQEEGPGHVHGEECYEVTETRTLTCGQEERPPITQAQTDESGNLSADKEPIVTDPGHTHSDACYTVETSSKLICTIPEGEGSHTHGEGCYETGTGLICGQEESAGHHHTEECYKSELICGLEEHTHTDECYATAPENDIPQDDPQNDVGIESQEIEVAGVEITDDGTIVGAPKANIPYCFSLTFKVSGPTAGSLTYQLPDGLKVEGDIAVSVAPAATEDIDNVLSGAVISFAAPTDGVDIGTAAYISEDGVLTIALNESDQAALGSGGTITVTMKATVEGDAAGGNVTVKFSDTIQIDFAEEPEGEVTAPEGMVARVGDTYYPTLAEAVEKATDGSTVYLLRDLVLDESVTVSGRFLVLDLGGFTLSATNNVRALHITVLSGETVEIKNGTIANCVDKSGGAIYADGGSTLGGTVIVRDLTLSGNSTNSFNDGGGAILASNICLQMEKCTVSGNTSRSQGGAIYLKGSTFIASETKFSGNSNSNSGGGAVYGTKMKGLTLTQCDFVDNRSQSNGGALYVTGASIKDPMVVSVSYCTFTGNAANGGYAAHLGTAIGTFEHSKVSHNYYEEEYSCIGGGLTVQGVVGDTGFTIKDVTFEGNDCDYSTLKLMGATGATGPITVQDCKIINNIHKEVFSSTADHVSIVYCAGQVKATFKNCEISGNRCEGGTSASIVQIAAYQTTVQFYNCTISDNIGGASGGIYLNFHKAPLTIGEGTVIKNNTATYEGKAAGGLYLDDKEAEITIEEGCAIYGNKHNDDVSDIYVNRPALVLPPASSMEDGEKDFTGYLWLDTVNDERYESLVNKEVSAPAMNLVAYLPPEVRKVARNGEKEFLTLADALKEAQQGDTIEVIIYEDGYGSLFQSAPITVDKDVTIDLGRSSMQAASENGGEPLITVAEGHTLTLTGNNAALDGTIEVKGSLDLSGNIQVKNIHHAGDALRVNGKMRTLAVTMDAGKKITAQKDFHADRITITLDDDTKTKLEEMDVSAVPDPVVLIEGYTEYGTVHIDPPIENKLISVSLKDGNIVLKKSTGVFLDGASGDDSRDGLTPEKAVKTFARAKAVLSEASYDTIYVTGTISISNEETELWSLAKGQKLQRCQGFAGSLIYISGKGSLTLSNIIIDGGREVEPNNAYGSLISMRGGTLTIGNGAVLRNNYSRDDGGAVLADANCKVTMTEGSLIEGNKAEDSGGGICLRYGSKLELSGGRFYNNESLIGGAIALNTALTNVRLEDGGILFMTGGTIEGNTGTLNGGGIFVGDCSEATITGGDIINNTVYGGGMNHFGGGGIYVNGGNDDAKDERYVNYENGKLYLSNVEISGNTADTCEGGGALAACPTSTVRLYLNHGAVIHDNEAPAEMYVTSVMDGSHAGNPHVTVTDYMLGGGRYGWTDGEGHKYELNEYAEVIMPSSSNLFFDTERTADENDVKNGQKLAKVRITGNHSSAQFGGGGIGTNGDVYIGTASTILRLEKLVDGASASSHGNDTFTFTIKFESDPGTVNVMRNGVEQGTLALDETNAATLQMKANDVILLTGEGLKEGLEYTITETVDNGADGVSVAYTKGTVGMETVEGSTVSGTILDVGYVTSVVFTNTFDNPPPPPPPSTPTKGRLVITKAIVGNASGAAEKEYTFTVTGPNEYNETVTITGAGTATLEDLEPGEYTINEADASIDGWDWTVTDDGKVTVQVKKGENEVTITNTYDELGSLQITKAINGGGDEALKKEYTFDVTGPSYPDGTEVTITGQGSATLNNLKHGEYTVTERDAQIDGYTWSVKSDGSATVVNGGQSSVTVTNTYTEIKGSLQITKNIVGGGAAAAGKVYTFDVTGPNGYSETVTVTGAGTATLEDLEPGEYTITEQDAEIKGYTLEVTGDTTATVTNDGNTAQATVTNTYTPSEGALTITKRIGGGGTTAATKVYTFIVTGPEGYRQTVTITGSDTVTLEGLVPGTYTITEADASIAGLMWSVYGAGAVTVNAGETADATIINVYTPPEEPDNPPPENPPDNPPETDIPNIPPPQTDIPETPTPDIDIPDNPPPQTDIPETPTPETDIPDNPPPETDIPGEQPPQTDIPDEEPPMTEIPDEEPPLTDIPDEEPPLTEIPDEDVPMDDVPQTGDKSKKGLWILMALFSALGMVFSLRKDRKEEDQ